MTQIPAIVLSVSSFLLSLYTLWLTQMRRGRLQMTRPTLIFIGLDSDPPRPKVYLRTLLFCTADRGCVVENMHLVVHNDGGAHIFDFWAYGEPKIAKGSGLFVPRNGVALHHHFVLNRRNETFKFISGNYRIDVFAKVVGQKAAVKLMTIPVGVVDEEFPIMSQLVGADLFLEWDVDTESYISRVRQRPDLHVDLD